MDASEGYTTTFIAVAGDCRATTGETPPARAGVAAVQHAMLAAHPGRWTQAEVLVASSPPLRAVAGTAPDVHSEQWHRAWDAWFAQPRPCLRASPLGKTYGWGLHFDAEGRITLHAVGSESYERLRRDPGLTQLTAMRSRRA